MLNQSPKFTETVGMIVTGSFAHLYGYFKHSIITFEVLFTGVTVKTVKVLFVQEHNKSVICKEYWTLPWTICFLNGVGVRKIFTSTRA